MKRGALALMAILAMVVPARAVPPAAVGALASDNVEWVASIPDLSPIGARILGDTMYMTTAQGLRIFDVSSGIPTPKGVLELPHYENEDVDTNGSILLIAADYLVGANTTLYVIDVSDPMLPKLDARLAVGAAHTASCILGCRYAWMGGAAGRVYVVDLSDPTAPKQLGFFTVPGLAHDIQVDDSGVAWVSAGGGYFGFRPSATDPLGPTPVVSLRNNTPGAFDNSFIVHNSLRPNASSADPAKLADANVDPGELVLVTEENWLTAQNGECANDGHFQTGHYTVSGGVARVQKLDSFNIGQGTVATPDRKPIAAQSCSSHYFDPRGDGIVAVAWYEQGTRFLDVSDPTNIRQVGYYMPAVGETFADYFHDGYVYTLDTYRGLEILRFTGGPGAAVRLAPSVAPRALSQPSPRWGYACRIPIAA